MFVDNDGVVTEDVNGNFFGMDANGKFNPQILAYQVRQAGFAWADADAAADLMESEKKSLLALLTNEHRALILKVSRKEAEDMALASDLYTNHLKAAIEARRVATRAQASYEAVKVFSRAIQTAEASRRAEMNIR